MKLTLYMFKSHVQNFSDCLKTKSESRNYRNITSAARKESDPDTRIYALEKEAKLPSWSNFVAGIAEVKEVEAMRTQSASVVILFRVETVDGPRIFAATYGSSFTLIETSLIESNFGLKTTINSISPNKIKNIDYKNISSRSMGRRESARRASSIANFVFEHENELLKSISGNSLDTDLGFTMSGGSSLKISIADLQPEQLKTIGQKVYDKYMLTTYKEHFDFIDHFEQEKDAFTVAELDNELVLALSQPTAPNRLFLAYPDQIPYQDCSYFRLTAANTNENFDDIEVGSLHTFLLGNASALDVETLKSDSYVTGLDDNEEAMTPRKSIYGLLLFEVVYKDSLYVLSDGKWYKIGRDFLESLNKWADQNIKLSNTKIKPWFKTQTEWDYCEQFADEKEYIILSKRSFATKRHGHIYLADLYHRPSNTLYFIKKLESASSFNHMLDQATTTADLLRENDSNTWNFLLQNAQEKWPEITHDSVSEKLSFEFVINDNRTLPTDLPVFHKVALKKAVKAIEKLQIKTSLKPLSVGLKK